MSAGSNSFGNLFRWTTFGESHGPAMGVVIDGCPSGLKFDFDLLKTNLQARRPGQQLTSPRQELDEAEVLSGVYQGLTLGTPIAVVVRNQDQRSEDYQAIAREPRKGHADDTWKNKFNHVDPRGGGRSSARETLNWVIAGSVGQMLTQQLSPELKVSQRMLSVGPLQGETLTEQSLQELLLAAAQNGESYGARMEVLIEGAPAGLGEPVFKKMKSELAQAYMGVNAVAAVSLGDGWSGSQQSGSAFHLEQDQEIYGGVRGGITTGEPLRFEIGFKPTASISQVAKQGRHDPCVALRAGPILTSLTWSVLADQFLMRSLNTIR